MTCVQKDQWKGGSLVDGPMGIEGGVVGDTGGLTDREIVGPGRGRGRQVSNGTLLVVLLVHSLGCHCCMYLLVLVLVGSSSPYRQNRDSIDWPISLLQPKELQIPC